MRAMQKLVKHGNATAVSIPRALLIHLGWFCGEWIILELLEDNSIRMRRPELRDVQPVGLPRLIKDSVAAVPR